MWIGNIGDYILYEDKELIVCRKPSGIAVQNARIGAMDMESALKNYLAAGETKKPNSTGSQPSYLGIVHRLDQPVEGVLVFAKTPRAAKELSRQMAANEMGKSYLAVTSGKPQCTQGSLEDYLKKDGRANTSAVVTPGTAGAKKARLRYKLLAEAPAPGQAPVQQQNRPDSSQSRYLLRIELETGRHHQIRVQMANAGMPLLGDHKYNPDNPGGDAGAGLALCSYRLSFRHPLTKKKMEFFVTPQGRAFDAFKSVLHDMKE